MIGNVIVLVCFVILVISPFFLILYGIARVFSLQFYGLRSMKQYKKDCSVVLTPLSKDYEKETKSYYKSYEYKKEEEVPSPSSIPYSFEELKERLTPDDDDIEEDKDICRKAEEEKSYYEELEKNNSVVDVEPLSMEEFNSFYTPADFQCNSEIYKDVIQLYT